MGESQQLIYQRYNNMAQSSVNALQQRVKQTQDVSMLQEMADKRRISWRKPERQPQASLLIDLS